MLRVCRAAAVAREQHLVARSKRAHAGCSRTCDPGEQILILGHREQVIRRLAQLPAYGLCQ
jgi:hypothetical protein